MGENQRHITSHPMLTFLPLEVEGVEALVELALNLRWSWDHSSDEVWKRLEPELWKLTNNPWIVLRTASSEKLKKLLSDPSFRKVIDDLVQSNRIEAESEAWFQKNHSQIPLSCIAYFSMEYMLCEALPIYSGGLGNVAGDQLKSASDLGVPVIAVGLLYQQGYFRQEIDKEGMQQALYPYNDPGQLPITPLRGSNGEWFRMEVALPGYSVWLRAWQVQVGRVKLYLLDSNDAANYPIHRGITSELYGGGSELRLKQEMLLGIGGWRLLDELGLKPEVCHLNEGHAAFAVLERAYCFMKATGHSFKVALAATRAGNLFTTHTAVPAGFDRFSPALIEQYLGRYSQDKLGISFHELMALGRQNPDDSTEPFNMAYLAIRGSGAVNGVSRLHGCVSRSILRSLFPGWPESNIPIGYVTNGVHVPSWDSVGSDALWTKSCGKCRWLGETESLQKEIRRVPEIDFWQMRNRARKSLIEYTRDRLSRQLAASGGSLEEVECAKHLFDPNTLTLGFARRFATYKRSNMLLHDPERLLKILTNPSRPVQLIIAGKAHPADKPGQMMIQRWMHFIRKTEARAHVIFLSDYDMLLTENLVRGVDIWINTPRRPWEACGTSGMKVLVNGGLNLSELDGWWAEAYTPEVGWALGDGKEHGDDPAWDAVEANALYELLEYEVIPQFYNRDSEGVPTAWVARMRESMATLTPQYSANRSVREYTETYYIPAAVNYQKRIADQAVLAKEMVEWQDSLAIKWKVLRFTELKIETNETLHEFEVHVYLNDLNPDEVQLELYAEPLNSPEPVREIMSRIRSLAGDSNTYVYHAAVPATRPANHYTPRAIPFFVGASVPLEAPYILWQR